MRTWLLLAVCLASCDPGWKIAGTVVDGAGAPVASASVSLSCSGSPDGAKATTDSSGQFSFGGVSGAHGSVGCSVAVAKSGFATRIVKATDVCHRSTEAKNYAQPCDSKSATIVLAP
jgi:hypothetical protein